MEQPRAGAGLGRIDETGSELPFKVRIEHGPIGATGVRASEDVAISPVTDQQDSRHEDLAAHQRGMDITPSTPLDRMDREESFRALLGTE